MTMDVLMPQLGETVAEGKITVWFKSVGDSVKPGDNLFEIETDKVSMEVPATSAGVLSEIRVPEGESAPVGAVVAVIGDAAGTSQTAPVRSAPASALPLPGGERGGVRGDKPLDRSVTPSPQPSPRSKSDISDFDRSKMSNSGKPEFGRGEGVPPAAAAQPSTQTRAAPLDPFMEVRTPERNFGPAKITGGVTVTPLARRLAGEGGIDLSHIKGSGPHGRIVARDVEQAAGAGRPAAPGAVTVSGGPSADQVKALYASTPYEEVPLDTMRRTIARRLTEAKQTVPHFYLTVDVAIDAVLKLREEANVAAGKGADGEAAYKLSVNDFVIKALAHALQRVPTANAVWAEDRILRFAQVDIGVAVAIEGGLLTPVIRRAESKSLSAISAEMKDLAARARARRLKPGEYQGGVSAVSNLGMYGIREFSAIINPPQSTILAVGAGQRRPVEALGGGVAFATQMTVTLSCDHRVVDGALGAEVLAAFKTVVESPVLMLV
ncbi:MAG: pyruvate dehydrogenase complex dihydrolipoamide acetyltransferase [Rhizobiales bacterium]|nr:pyruvate dehydrogenase complex dihydrolipoamide acetyltransferase [Hyphomicrobiales bacterium]